MAARGRLALVGDAAGLVDPVSGDGIFEAVLSARLVAANAEPDSPPSLEPNSRPDTEVAEVVRSGRTAVSPNRISARTDAGDIDVSGR